ncbi:MAG: flagellar assembly protein T N-terminal domain-containing protein [bacterium]
MKKIFLIIISAFIFSACSSSKQYKKDTAGGKEEVAVVEAEGIANIKNNNIVKAKKRALSDAQKNAVEMAVGVYVNSVTRVEKSMLVEQKIFSKTNGYIKKYKILSEGEKNNFYKIKIEAVVKIEEINKDINDAGLNQQSRVPTDLLFAVVIEDRIDEQNNTDKVSENVIAEKLLNKNYKLGQINTQDKSLLSDLAGNPEGQKKLGETFKSDVLITGKSSATLYKENVMGNLISYNANISFKIIKISESALIYSNSFSSGGLGITKDAAAKEALKRAASLASEDISKVLEERLKKFNYITVVVKNVSTINQLNSIMRGIEDISEIENTTITSFTNGVAKIKLETGVENASVIVREMESQIENVVLKITAVSGDFVEIEIQ